MIRIVITKELRNNIFKTFKQDSRNVYKLLLSLKKQPNKGKLISTIGTMLLKELKYRSFRFYFIIDGNSLYLFNAEKLEELLIQFMKMSKKNDQQKTIDKIKEILRRI